jgi:DNA repair exonuclease SbcCD ATPase subunit
VNRKLTDQQIISTFDALSSTGIPVSGRALRTALRAQFGAAGKTERVFALCRSLRSPDEPASVTELRQKLQEAERGMAAAQEARDQALERVERAEAREMAHQDRWANEIYALRQTVQQLQGQSKRRRELEDQVLRLQRELQGLRNRLGPDAKPTSD